MFVGLRKFKSAKELGYKSQLNKIQNCKSQKDIVSANRKYIKCHHKSNGGFMNRGTYLWSAHLCWFQHDRKVFCPKLKAKPVKL